MQVKGHQQHVDARQRQPNEAVRSVLPAARFLTVKSPFQGFKLQSLSINSLDLDKVALQKAHRPSALWAAALSLARSRCQYAGPSV